MTKALGLLLAMIVSLTILALAIMGAEWLAARYLSHAYILHGWWRAAPYAFLGIALSVAGLKRHRTKREETEPLLAPLVRRSPKTGLREL